MHSKVGHKKIASDPTHIGKLERYTAFKIVSRFGIKPELLKCIHALLGQVLCLGFGSRTVVYNASG